MTKCYDGKNAKTNACGSGIQAPLVATPTPFHNVVKNFTNSNTFVQQGLEIRGVWNSGPR